MKHIKTVTKKSTYEVVDSVVCDICKKTYNDSWNKSSDYDVLEVEIRMKTGSSYPESGSGEETTFDVCPDCFKNRVIPELQKFGAEPTVSEWDY